jgi:alcohol dehydrogenase class IV
VHAAALLGSDAEGPDALPDVLLALMQDLGVPTNLSELGYDESDIPALVEGALAQARLLAVAPREVGAADLSAILRASLS